MDNLVAIGDLAPGMVIIQITQQNGPVKIRKSGLVNSPEMVQGLAEMGVLEVEVDPAQAVEIEINETPSSPTKQLLMSQTRANQGSEYSVFVAALQQAKPYSINSLIGGRCDWLDNGNV
jgi:general secretion pathway protein B